MVDVQISLAGPESISGLEELSAWLVREPELRGRIKPLVTPPRPGELGAVTEVLVATLGAGGAVSVLASSLRAFLSQPRRSDVRITVQSAEGRRVEVDAKRVADVESLLKETLERAE